MALKKSSSSSYGTSPGDEAHGVTGESQSSALRSGADARAAVEIWALQQLCTTAPHPYLFTGTHAPRFKS